MRFRLEGYYDGELLVSVIRNCEDEVAAKRAAYRMAIGAALDLDLGEAAIVDGVSVKVEAINGSC